MERFIHGGDIYKENKTWLDFSANINPQKIPPKAKEAIIKNVDNIINYPDPRNLKLMGAVSDFYQIPKENIILGNGASELIYLFFLKLLLKRILIIAPSFSDYERAAIASGSEVEFLNLKAEDNFAFPWENLTKNAQRFDCVVFGSPNNPTGTMVSLKDVEIFLDKIPQNIFVFIDESFMDFRKDRALYETLSLAAKRPRLFTLKSLTKFYAIPGLRLGFAVTNKELIKSLNEAKDVWNINILASVAGVFAINDKEYRENTLSWLKMEQDFMTKELRKLNIKFYEPQANFILCEFESEEKAKKIREGLKLKNILVRNCENFISLDARFIRIAIKSREDNEKFIKSLKEIL